MAVRSKHQDTTMVEAGEMAWNYQPKHKVGTAVMTRRGSIGTIDKIDNLCNVRDNMSPMPEYYILWSRDLAWTRHDCDEFDRDQSSVGWGFDQEAIRVLTKAGQILYGKADKAKTKRNRERT